MFFPMHSYANNSYRISDVLIKGLKNVSLKSVLAVVDLKKGKQYSKYKAKKDAASIASLGYFDNVKVYFNKQNGNLIFEVSEDLFIERIVFRGNSEFSPSRLKSISRLKERGCYDFSKLEDAKKKIGVLYRNKGYVNCKIEVHHTVNTDTNKVTVTFLITENKKIVIKSVKVKGVIHFKEKEILKLMKTRLKKVFKEDIYQMDLKSIETFYKNNGFVDYQFISSSVEYNDAKTEMFLTLNINEGTRYKIGSVTYNGNFSIYDDGQIGKMIKIKKGKVFSQHDIEEITNHIREFYVNKGYLRIVVEPCFDKKSIYGIIDVNFLIKENEVFYLGNIYINGLYSTKNKVIKREMLMKSGKVFSVEKLLRSIERIYSLGFIENVEHNELFTDVPNVIDVEFYVTESARNSTTAVSFGYSSSASFTGLVQLQHINVFGLGQKLNLFYEVSKKQQNYEIGWMDPWAFDKNMSLNLNAYRRNNILHRKMRNCDKGSISSVLVSRNKNENKNIIENDKRIGIETKLGPRIGERVSLLFGYGYENVDFCSIIKKENVREKNNETARIRSEYSGDEVYVSSEKGKISSIFSHFLYDSRDYVFDPSKGSVKLVTLQIASKAFGGNKNFVKGIVNLKWFFPTFYKFVLSTNLQFGLITPYGRHQSVPIYERFYIGGANTVRGYDRDEIDPYNGGKFMGIINVEHKFPIISQGNRTVIQGFLFYDAGELFVKKTQKYLYQSVGFGIRLPIPMLPIRFDCAYGLTKTKHKPKFYFTLGNIF
jgi:outer membrane protein insertion porin family